MLTTRPPWPVSQQYLFLYACLPAYIFTAVQKGPLLSPGALLQQVWLCHPGLANIKLSSIFYTKRQPAPSARACPGRFQKYCLKQVLFKKSLVQKLKILHWEFQTNIESPAYGNNMHLLRYSSKVNQHHHLSYCHVFSDKAWPI